MEVPYKGRAILQDNLTDFVITIPAKRNWFVVVFLGAWLGGWFLGEAFALTAVAGFWKGNPAGLFILFWLAGWTVGGLFVIKTLVWLLVGQEVITLSRGQLSVAKKGDLLAKTKVYDLREVRQLRVQEDLVGYGPFTGRRLGVGAFAASSGTIRFDYGLQTVKFAGYIAEAEARMILNRLRERHFLADINFQ